MWKCVSNILVNDQEWNKNNIGKKSVNINTTNVNQSCSFSCVVAVTDHISIESNQILVVNMSDHLASFNSLSSDVQSIRTDVNSLTSDIKNPNGLTPRVESLESQLKKLEPYDIAELQNAVQDLVDDDAAFEQDIDYIEQDIDNLKYSIGECEDNIANQANNLTEANKKITTLETTIDDLSSQVVKLENQVKKLEKILKEAFPELFPEEEPNEPVVPEE